MLNDVEKYWLAVAPVTDGEYKKACAHIRENYSDHFISRRRALQLDLPIYRMRKPCKRGHKSWRYTHSQACVACMRVRPDGKLARHRGKRARRVDMITRDLMRSAPDLVINATDARAAGLTAYRLGEPCGLCGERTWRNLDTMACVECLPYTVEPQGQDLVFEESFAALRETVDTLDTGQLQVIEKDMLKRRKKDKRNSLDFTRVLRFVRRHIRERNQ